MEPVESTWVGDHRTQLRRDIAMKSIRRSRHLTCQLCSSVDERHDIREITAAEIVSTATIMEGLELGRQQVRRSERADRRP